jgi:hypothetical protein
MATKTFDQSYSETGRQSELDALRKDPAKYDAAKSAYESSAGLAPTQQISKIVPTGNTVDNSGMLYGGWYNNPAAGGKNQRYWGNGVWTDGDEPGLPKDSNQVTSYLNDYQNSILNKSIPEVRNMLSGGLEKPQVLNREQAFTDLRAEYGVADLETRLNELKGEEDELVAAFRQQRAAERDKTVATNVIEGRISREERDANERLDYLGRQKSRIVDELNTKYSVIGQIMDFKSLDYQDAVQAYESEFNANLAVYKLISDETKAAESSARANLQIYMNAITAGNLDYGSLDAGQKAMISKLEVQSGLPVGFTSSLKLDPKANVLFTTSNDGVTQVGVRNPDGSISVQSYGTKISGGKQTEAEFNKAAQKEVATFLSSKSNSYGHVSGTVYTQVRNQWVQETGKNPDEFDQTFRAYRDPYNLGQYGLTRTEEDR